MFFLSRFCLSQFIRILGIVKKSTFIVILCNIVFCSNDLWADDSDLELSVWLSDESSLVEVEKRIISHIQSDPKNPYYFYLLSQTFIRIFLHQPSRFDLIQKSSELSEHALALDPQSEFGYLSTINILDVLGKYPQAYELLDTLQDDPTISSSWRLICTKAKILSEANLDKKLNMYKDCLKQADSKIDLIIPHIIATLVKNFDSKELDKELMKWNKIYPHIEFDILRADNLVTLDKYKLAKKVYKRILAKRPDHLDIKINYARLLYNNLGMKRQAYSLLNGSLKKLTKHNESYRFIIQFHLGRLSLSQRKFKRTQHYYLNSIKNAPDKDLVLSYILESYKEEHRYKELTDILKILNEELPGRAHLYAYAGNIYSDQLNKHQNAVESYHKALILEPNNSYYHTSLGLAYYHLENYKIALSVFNTALKIDPNNTIAMYNKACVLSMTHNIQAALATLKKAISKDPSLIKIAKDDKDFTNIKALEAFKKITRQVQ